LVPAELLNLQRINRVQGTKAGKLIFKIVVTPKFAINRKDGEFKMEQNRQSDDMQVNSLITQEKGELITQTDIVTRSVVKNLIRAAIEGMGQAYAPYSNQHVGAALLTAEEEIYNGCNIENAAFGPTNCAERTAVFKAISEGKRKFVAIAVVGGRKGIIQDFFPPCGVCRQVLREFVDPKSFLVILARSEEDYVIYSLESLLPLSFGPDYM
jgi:cytidine deaminase